MTDPDPMPHTAPFGPAPFGPLAGVRVVEIAGLGPTPFAAMTLADMGAEVIRIERPGARHIFGLSHDILNRGRPALRLDLKSDAGRAVARRLIARADLLIEGMRPGVMERLGLGPGDFPDHPRLVYGRMTGWGQSGPLAARAGHDITYLALTGALHAIGPEGAPVPPLNLLGDFGGGGIYLAFGLVAALFAAQRSGRGQVVDAAITDGVAHLSAMIHALRNEGQWADRRGANLLDGGAPYYSCYACACGGHLAVGAIEPAFWAALLEGLGLAGAALPDRDDPAQWPALRARLASVIGAHSRDHWAAVFDGTDACAAPVLTLDEATRHPHNLARGTFVPGAAGPEPAPAPRLSATPGQAGGHPPEITPDQALALWGA